MRNFLKSLILVLANLLAASATLAQSPPGWGWVKQMGTFVGGTTAANSAAGLGRDAAGNLYLLGTYVGAPVLSGVPTTSQGASDIFLAKYAPTGTLLWLRTIQSSGGDVASALTVEPGGRCTLTGAYGSGSGGNLAFSGLSSPTVLPGPAQLGLAANPFGYGAIPFVAAIDAGGTLLWADNPSAAYGVVLTAIHRDNSGNCYVSGRETSQSSLLFNGQGYPPVGSNDALLVKYTAAGQPAWLRRVGVVGGSSYNGDVYTDNANAVYWLVGHSGNLTIDQVTVGVASGTGTNSLVKLSANNTVRWIKNDLLRVGVNNAVGGLLHFDAATNALYLSGYSSGGAVAYSGSGSPVAVPANAYTQCVARCDTAGQVLWVKPVVSATNVPGNSWQGGVGAAIKGFAVRGNGFTLVTSTARSGATTFAGSSRTFGVAEGGLTSVVHFNAATFQAEWIRVGGVPATVQEPGSHVTATAIDPADNVYVAGTFSGTAQFGATTMSAPLSQPEIFLAKLDQSLVTGAKGSTTSLPWSVYPNPTTGTVQLTGLPATAQVRVYDGLGRLVRELPAAARQEQGFCTLQGLGPGLYLLQVTDTPEPYRIQRLMVQ